MMYNRAIYFPWLSSYNWLYFPKSTVIYLPLGYLRWNEKILRRSYLKWIFLFMKITRTSRKWLKHLYGTGKGLSWKLILIIVIFVISQGNVRGLGIGCVILKKWAIISLTFVVSSWKGKSTSGKTFVRFSHSISQPYGKKMTKDFKIITMGNMWHAVLK